MIYGYNQNLDEIKNHYNDIYMDSDTEENDDNKINIDENDENSQSEFH